MVDRKEVAEAAEAQEKKDLATWKKEQVAGKAVATEDERIAKKEAKKSGYTVEDAKSEMKVEDEEKKKEEKLKENEEK